MQQNLANKKNGNAFVVKWAQLTHTTTKKVLERMWLFRNGKRKAETVHTPEHSNNSPEKHWTQIKCKVDFTNHDQGFLLFVRFFFTSLLKTILVCCSYFFLSLSSLVLVLLFTLSLHLIHSSVYHFECVWALAFVLRFLQPIHFTSLHCANVVYISKCTSAAATEDVVSVVVVVVVVWSAIVSNLYSLMHLAKEN